MLLKLRTVLYFELHLNVREALRVRLVEELRKQQLVRLRTACEEIEPRLAGAVKICELQKCANYDALAGNWQNLNLLRLQPRKRVHRHLEYQTQFLHRNFRKIRPDHRVLRLFARGEQRVDRRLRLNTRAHNAQLVHLRPHVVVPGNTQPVLFKFYVII